MVTQSQCGKYDFIITVPLTWLLLSVVVGHYSSVCDRQLVPVCSKDVLTNVASTGVDREGHNGPWPLVHSLKNEKMNH